MVERSDSALPFLLVYRMVGVGTQPVVVSPISESMQVESLCVLLRALIQITCRVTMLHICIAEAAEGLCN